VNNVTALQALCDGDNLKLVKGHKGMDPFNILGGTSLMASSGTAGHANLQKFKTMLTTPSPSTPVRTGTGLGESCGKSLVPACLRLPYGWRSCELDMSHSSFLEKQQTLRLAEGYRTFHRDA